MSYKKITPFIFITVLLLIAQIFYIKYIFTVSEFKTTITQKSNEQFFAYKDIGVNKIKPKEKIQISSFSPNDEYFKYLTTISLPDKEVDGLLFSKNPNLLDTNSKISLNKVNVCYATKDDCNFKTLTLVFSIISLFLFFILIHFFHKNQLLPSTEKRFFLSLLVNSGFIFAFLSLGLSILIFLLTSNTIIQQTHISTYTVIQ